MREYIEEFYKVNLRAGYIEDTSEKTTKYINGLRMDIQEEMSMLSANAMEEAYQYALKAEEKISRKQTFGRGRGVSKSRGQMTGSGRVPVHRDEAGVSTQQDQVRRGHESRGGRPYQRGKGRDRGRESVDVTLVTNLVIDPTSALIMKRLDRGVTIFPKENKHKYKYLRWIMHLRLGKIFL